MAETWISHGGEPPITELEPLPDFDLSRGHTFTRTWVGSRERILAKYYELLASGVQSARPSYGGDGMTLQLVASFAGVYNPNTGTIETGENTITTEWSSEPSTITKSIWDSPQVRAQFALIGDEGFRTYLQQRIRNLGDALVRGDTEVAEELLARTQPAAGAKASGKTKGLTISDYLSFVSDAGLSQTVFLNLLLDLLRGVTTWTPNSWTLRRSRRVPQAVVFSEISANVGRMLTLSALGSEGFSASLLKTPLPSGGYWLKQAPVDRPAGDGSREIVTDYWWTEEYSTFLYGSPVTA